MKNNLPKEVTVTREDLGIDSQTALSDVIEALSDYLSNTYGFCHNGFDYELLDSRTIQAYNIQWDTTE